MCPKADKLKLTHTAAAARNKVLTGKKSLVVSCNVILRESAGSAAVPHDYVIRLGN